MEPLPVGAVTVKCKPWWSLRSMVLQSKRETNASIKNYNLFKPSNKYLVSLQEGFS